MREPNFKDAEVDRIRREGAQVTGKVREQVIGYIAAGLGVVAGLAWNDAITALIENLFPLEKSTLAAKFVYAVIITVVVVVITTYLLRLFKKREQAESQSQ